MDIQDDVRMNKRYVTKGDHKMHKYIFTGKLVMLSGMTMDVEGTELIETDVHWLVKTHNGYEMHVPKSLYVREEQK